MTEGIEAAIEALSADPALAGSFGLGSAALVWDDRADRVLWASAAAADLRALVAGPGGQVVADFPDRRRLAALAGGLAPLAGFKVEHLRFSPDPDQPAAELSCRLLRIDGTSVLLTVFAEPLPKEVGPDHPLNAGGQEVEEEEELHPPFVERLRGQGRRRFIWSMDREGRFTSVSPPLGEVVGPENAAILGLTWPELVDRWVLAESSAIEDALASRSTWSDEAVLWRVADTSYVVPVDVGGMPVFGRGHEFEGFRGFGLCRGDEVRPAPDSPVLAAAAPAPSEPVEETVDAVSRVEAEGEGAGAQPELAFQTIHARVGAQLGGARSVPLRAVPESDAVPRGGTARPSLPGEDAAEAKPFLSMAERGALREIARALGARLESDETAEPPPSRAPAEIVSISALRPRDPDATRILDRLPIGVVILRGEAPLFANRFLLDLLGYADAAELRTASRIFAGRARGQTAMGLQAKNGARVPVAVTLTGIEWGDGPASLLVIQPLVARDGESDLTRSFELELGRRDERIAELHATLDIAGTGVLTLDRAGRILSANRAAERIFGYAENEIAGEGFTAVIAVESHRAAIDLVDAARARPEGERAPAEVELFGRPRAGDPVPLLARAGLCGTTPDGAVALVLRDVSGFRRTEAELTRARRDAEDAASRQTEFLARVSHEIRTPLNAIIGFAELMLEERFGPVGSERYRNYLRDIHDSGGHVVSLVNDLLDLAKVTAGRSELVFTSLDLNEIVSGSVGLLQPAAARERIVLRTSFAAELPRLIADERSIRQITLNLVSNAVRFTGPGGQVIVSTSRTERGELVFRVRDTGIGMTPAEVAEALEPFRQVSVVRREDGTGLGLPLSKALVEANRGSFSITSRRGEGTLAEVLFPPARVLAET